jgi:NADH-quinone oxidoreductase subunit N
MLFLEQLNKITSKLSIPEINFSTIPTAVTKYFYTRIIIFSLSIYFSLILLSNIFNFSLAAKVLLPDLCFFLLVIYYLLEGLFFVTEANEKYANYFPIKSSHYCLILGCILVIIGLLQGFNALWLESFDINKLYFYYNSFKVSPVILKIKMILSFLVAAILYLSANFLKNNKLNNYEFSFILAIALISLWIAVSALSWLLLYLSLELQALCLFILMSWSRNLTVSINTALKYGVINFVASALMLYGIVRLILLTGDTSFLSIPSEYSELFTNNSLINQYYIVVFPITFILMGLFIKLGVAPLSFWVPEIYAGLPLPVLMFFATAPKFVYVFLISNFLVVHFSYFIFDQLKLLFLLLAVLTTVIGTFGLMTEKRDIMRFVGWSSISNLGVLFLLWGLINQNQILFSLSLTYMFYYVVNTLLFLGVFNYLYLPAVNRQIFYFSDLQILLRHSSLNVFYLIIMCSFFSFLGLPPFLGFWGKFIALRGLIAFITTPFEWFVVIFVLLLTVAGGFNYIRLFNSIGAENTKENFMLTLAPIETKIFYHHLVMFISCQIGGCLLIPLIINIFENTQSLFC